MKNPKIKTKPALLIALCWLVYAVSHTAKLSYNANISPIGDAYGVSYAEAGMVATFFFFAYGIGQVINGMFCKRYNPKAVIFVCLICSGAFNFSIPFIDNFHIIKFIWLCNGIAMSFLWTLLIRVLSETLPKEYINRAIVVMGTTVATGTFAVYGLSSLFAAIASFRIVFFITAGLILTIAILWLVLYNKLVTPLKNERANGIKNETLCVSKKGTIKSILPLIIILLFFAIANNFVKDGLTAWTPDILKTLYSTPDWLSILLTLLLPLMGICGIAITIRLYGKTKSFIGTCGLLFFAAGILAGGVILLLNFSFLPLTVSCFALVSCFMAGVNNVITSMVPLHLRDKISSGKLAGILNGACYLGSTLSSYTLGAVADKFNWGAVLYLLLGVIAFSVVLSIIYLLSFEKKRTNKG